MFRALVVAAVLFAFSSEVQAGHRRGRCGLRAHHGSHAGCGLLRGLFGRCR